MGTLTTVMIRSFPFHATRHLAPAWPGRDWQKVGPNRHLQLRGRLFTLQIVRTADDALQHLWGFT